MHVAPKICDARSARADLFFERSVLRVERPRARADGAERQLQLDAEAIGVFLHLLDRGLVAEDRRRQRNHRPRQLQRAEMIEILQRA